MKNLNTDISENNATTPPQNDKEFRGNLIFFLSKDSGINFKYVSNLLTETSEYSFLLKQSLFIDKETPPPKFFS